MNEVRSSQFYFVHAGSTTQTVIDRILAAHFETTEPESNPETNEISQQCYKLITQNQYEDALDVTLKGLERFPRSFILQARLASALSDHAMSLDNSIKDELLKKADEIFNKLYEESACQIGGDKYLFLNEYYYRYKLHQEQYENGLSAIEWYAIHAKEQLFRGYYFQGVGAANYAKQLIQKGEKELACEYADKAIISWAQHFSHKNDYYNSYVHYGLALGILGHEQEMMRALKRGADLIRVDLDYFEFKEIVSFVKAIYPSNLKNRL